MGQIANQMALELFFRIKERIKEKKKQKKKSSRLPLSCAAMYHTTGSVLQLNYAQQKSPGGVIGGGCRRNTALLER